VALVSKEAFVKLPTVHTDWHWA